MRHCKKKIARRDLRNLVSLIFFITCLLATFLSIMNATSDNTTSLFLVLYFCLASGFSLFLCLTYAKDL